MPDEPQQPAETAPRKQELCDNTRLCSDGLKLDIAGARKWLVRHITERLIDELAKEQNNEHQHQQ